MMVAAMEGLPASGRFSNKEVILARVLVLYASIGSGHQKAAEAIADALKNVEVGHHQVSLVDVLSCMNPLYRILVPRGYLWLARRLPFVLGILYGLTNHSVSHSSPMLILRSFVSRLFSWGFAPLVQDFSPQIVICTHFLPVELMFSGIMEKWGSPAVLVSITDIVPHAFWVHPSVGRYFVADEISLRRLADRGVPQEKIHVSGIPVHSSFSVEDRTSPERLRHHAVLNLLIVGGGGGIAPVEKLLGALSRYHLPVTMTVVAGSNRGLYRRLSRLKKTYALPLFVKGYVQEMSHVMRSADLVITKPGGLTTAECLAMGKPMILFSPIPGQEEENQKALQSWGVALVLDSPGGAPSMIRSLVGGGGLLAEMTRMAKIRGRGDAAGVVCREMLDFLEEAPCQPVSRKGLADGLRKGGLALGKWF